MADRRRYTGGMQARGVPYGMEGRRRGGGRGRGTGRGGGRGRGGGAGRGRGRGFGGRGGRGRGRGSGRGRSQAPVQRYHEQANQSLKNSVEALNATDERGVQRVKVWKYDESGWVKVESLSSGKAYFRDDSNESAERKVTWKEPAELKGQPIVEQQSEPLGFQFPQPPTDFRIPNKLLVRNVVTNAFPVRGSIMDTAVYCYEVKFEPPIPYGEQRRRRNALYGSDEARTRMNEKFGYHEFDNHALYSLSGTKARKDMQPKIVFEWGAESAGSKKPREREAPDSKGAPKVIFILTDVVTITDTALPKEQQESLLNIFCRNKLGFAAFGRIHNAWFYKRPHSISDDRMKPIQMPSCEVLQGFECAIHVPQGRKQKQEAVFKVNTASKLVSKSTVRDLILRQFRPESKDFRRRVKQELVGKHFVMSYNPVSKRIADVVFSENEDSTFEHRDFGTVSYKDYLRSEYGVPSPSKEAFVLKDSRGSAFLPQHAKLTITSDQVASDYDDILRHTTPGIHDRLRRVDGFLALVEKRRVRAAQPTGHEEDTKSVSSGSDWAPEVRAGVCPVFEIEKERPVMVNAMRLTYPHITFMGKGNRPITENLGDRSFRWSQTGGFLRGVKRLSNWVVIANDPRIASGIQGFVDTYLAMRRFAHPLPIEYPSFVQADMRHLENCHRWLKGQSYQLALVVLPEGMFGSKVKNTVTKELQKAGNETCVLQFVQSRNARNKNAMIGTFEDMMAKMGNVLYEIHPVLPAKTIDPSNTWVMGLELSHNKGNPSVAMMCLMTKPCQGSMRDVHFAAHLMPRRDVVGYDVIIAMAWNLLEQAFATKTQYPANIIFYRGGVTDNRLSECYSKEMVGLQRAIRLWEQTHRVGQWRPRVEFVVASHSSIDRFGMADARGGVRPVNCPAVIFNGVTSYRCWEFILWPFHPKKGEAKTKPVRYVILKDGLGLAKNGGYVDLFQFTYALGFAFVFSVPFPLGPTSRPAPLAYAKRKAESFAQLIFKDDNKVKDLQRDKGLRSVPHLICEEDLKTDVTN